MLLSRGSSDVVWISVRAGGGSVQMTEEREGDLKPGEMTSQGTFQGLLVSL